MNRVYLKKQPIEEPTINLTPLIDVVFVILIMFILIAPLLEIDRIALAMSANTTLNHKQEVHETSAINIHVRDDNTIWLNQIKILPAQLLTALTEMRKKHPQARPQLFHDKSAHFGTYLIVKNAAEQVGFSELDLILKPN